MTAVAPATVSAALLAGVSAAVSIRPRQNLPTRPRAPDDGRRPVDDPGWLHRGRWLWAALAGLGGATFVSGSWGAPAGLLVGVVTWTWIGRTEPMGARRRRESAARELPWLVHLLVEALESGCDVADALRLACEALPGSAADLLEGVPRRLSLGVVPDAAWRSIRDDPQLAPLARTMVRAHRSGGPVTREVARLALELEGRSQARAEERARSVGVKAALPLGLCLLPAFLLTGVVPLAVSLLRSLAL